MFMIAGNIFGHALAPTTIIIITTIHFTHPSGRITTIIKLVQILHKLLQTDQSLLCKIIKSMARTRFEIFKQIVLTKIKNSCDLTVL